MSFFVRLSLCCRVCVQRQTDLCYCAVCTKTDRQVLLWCVYKDRQTSVVVVCVHRQTDRPVLLWSKGRNPVSSSER